MAESKTRDDQTGSRDVEAQDSATVEQKKPYKTRRSKKNVAQTVDEMRITELKDVLRTMKLSTTGNKTQLQLRLRNARARECITDVETNRRAERDEESTSDEEVTDDEEESNDEVTSDEENRDEQRQDALGKMASIRTWQNGCDEPNATAVRSQRMKRERTQLSARARHDDDTDAPVERRREARNRVISPHSSFTIKDV